MTPPVAELPVRDEIGRRIRRHREESNLSLREFARRLGISASAVSQIETGKSRPSLNTLHAVIAELGLSADDLFSPLGPASAPGRLTRQDVRDDVGKRIRSHREESNLSLREFARRLGISPSAVSQIETGKSRPSLGTLHAVIDELGLSADELFSPMGPAASPPPPTGAPATRGAKKAVRHVQRAAARAAIELESGVRWERLTPGTDEVLEFLHVEYEVGGTSSKDGRFVRHAGREYGVVVSGTLEVAIGFETHRLGPGDSVCFDATTPHLVWNAGDEPAQCIWCVVGRDESVFLA